MSTTHQIKSEKIHVKKIFTEMWFRIPDYQRPYIWGRDEINDLLDDMTFALNTKPDQEYFLGSFVFQPKKTVGTNGKEYTENDLLDGQQRMTTLLMLFACIRDLSDDDDVRQNCIRAIYQKGDKIDKIPERTRIVFAIREEVQEFVNNYVKAPGGTSKVTELEALEQKAENVSVRNMARAIIEMRRYLSAPEQQVHLEDFITFLRNEVLLIYVATESLDDAFRLFTILNDRGVPLRNSDILKSMNPGALENDTDKTRFAKLWEEAESSLGEEFDRFLNYIRTILVKEKARLNLLQEFEQRIYDPKAALLKKGKDTFEMIDRYLKHYNQLLSGNNYDDTGESFRFDNLTRVMLTGLPSTDWVPPLLRYFDRFGYQQLLPFLTKLDNKFSADWIAQYTPTDRIENMNDVIRAIEAAQKPEDVLQSKCFEIDGQNFVRNAEASVYGRRFTRYLLIKLDYFYHDHAHRMSFESLSVEHVLPQNPSSGSQWRKDFTDEDRVLWTNKLGNLVLITRKKNTAQGNADYSVKKDRYFSKNINTCANSLRVLKREKWTPVELKANHDEVLTKIRQHYGVNGGGL